jgi:hypothetical protein
MASETPASLTAEDIDLLRRFLREWDDKRRVSNALNEYRAPNLDLSEIDVAKL